MMRVGQCEQAIFVEQLVKIPTTPDKNIRKHNNTLPFPVK